MQNRAAEFSNHDLMWFHRRNVHQMNRAVFKFSSQRPIGAERNDQPKRESQDHPIPNQQVPANVVLTIVGDRQTQYSPNTNAQQQNQVSPNELPALEGLAGFLDEDRAAPFADPFIELFIAQDDLEGMNEVELQENADDEIDLFAEFGNECRSCDGAQDSNLEVYPRGPCCKKSTSSCSWEGDCPPRAGTPMAGLTPAGIFVKKCQGKSPNPDDEHALAVSASISSIHNCHICVIPDKLTPDDGNNGYAQVGGATSSASCWPSGNCDTGTVTSFGHKRLCDDLELDKKRSHFGSSHFGSSHFGVLESRGIFGTC